MGARGQARHVSGPGSRASTGNNEPELPKALHWKLHFTAPACESIPKAGAPLSLPRFRGAVLLPSPCSAMLQQHFVFLSAYLSVCYCLLQWRDCVSCADHCQAAGHPNSGCFQVCERVCVRGLVRLAVGVAMEAVILVG